MTIEKMKRALLEVSMYCGATKRCSSCGLWNQSALECSLKGIPSRWWVHFLNTETVDAILKEDSNAAIDLINNVPIPYDDGTVSDHEWYDCYAHERANEAWNRRVKDENA